MWIQAAGPFLVGAILLPAGSLIGKGALRNAMDTKYRPALENIPANRQSLAMRPETIENMTAWATDATQLLGIVVAPSVGLIFFAGEVNPAVIALYTIALLAAFLTTFWFVTYVNPVNYREIPLGVVARNRMIGVKGWRALTPVTMIGIYLNLGAAVLAAALTAF
jgi:hypothetical protein